MIEVAVIGAGSAGIVAARHLISAGLRPTIFEVAKTIGGAWTPSPAFSERTNDKSEYAARKMWYGLHTNLSKYTCQFTDWPWPEDTATFPSVDEMHRYLQSYSDNFLDSESCDFQFECEVMNVDRLQTIDTSGNLALSDGQACYSVEWLDLKTKIRANKEFNGVVVATGFFNTPKFPSFLKDYSKRNSQEKRPEVIHSSDYHIHSEFENKNVAVIGASFSALEIAADLSQSASRVINVVSSVPWVLPRWLSKIEPLQMTESTPSEDAPHRDTITILPVDLAFYQRNDPFPQEEVVHLDEESCQERHKFLRSLAGHKQKHSPLGEPVHWNEPPFIAISDEYLDLIREGKIEVVKGRLEGINDDGSLSLSDSRTIQDIDAVICCTGYTPHLQSILSSTILETLEYDHEDTFGPLSLAWDVMYPSLPGLAFCGMYRGPYMGVMDLQARLLAGTMSGKLCPDKEKLQSALETNRLIRTANPRAQFPRFDYIGYMDTLAMLCYNGEHPTINTKTGDMVVPPLYQPNKDMSQGTSLDLQEELLKGQDGSRMPKLILQSILGNWTYDRNIIHFQTLKTERVSGTVKYTKYSHTTSSQSDTEDIASNDDKYVKYREDGLYELSPTQKFEVFREYEYIAKHDALEIYFVEGGKRAHLFLSLKFVPETKQSNDGHWVKATSDHLCIKDLYSANFRVKLDGLSASEVIIKYRVKGPSKDYESTTVLKPVL